MFEPLEFIEKLVALVPKPRANLTRYHGMLGPAAKWRPEVIPAPPIVREIQPAASATSISEMPIGNTTEASAVPAAAARQRLAVEVDMTDPEFFKQPFPRATMEYSASDLRVEPIKCSPEGLTGTIRNTNK